MVPRQRAGPRRPHRVVVALRQRTHCREAADEDPDPGADACPSANSCSDADAYADVKSIRQAMDRLFEDSFVRPNRWPAAAGKL